MNNSMKKWLLGSVAASAMVSALPAMAQESQGKAAAAQAGTEVQGIEEVVITARRRQESILKVPVVVAVLDAKHLDQYAVDNIAGIANHVPGLQINTAVASFGSQVSLRGVGTSTTNAATDQSVSLNIDGMQMTQGIAYAAGFFDMADVQVMKGPQALFYGKASPAGVIAIRSADPTDQFEAVVKGSYEIESREKRGEFAVSGPVTNTLKIRLAGSYSDAEGYFRNNGVVGNQGLITGPLAALPGVAASFGPLGAFGGATPPNGASPSAKNKMLRGTILWDVTEDLKARFKINYIKSEVEGAAWDAQLGSCPEGNAPTNAFGVRFLSPNEDCKLDRHTTTIAVNPANFAKAYNNGVPFASAELIFGTLDLSYNINPELTLSSLTGYATTKQIFMENGSNSSFAGPPFLVEGDYKRDDFTQELRLTSNYSGPLNFMVGGFYQDGNQDAMVNLPTNNQLSQLLGYAGAVGAAIPALMGGNPAPLFAVEANAHGYPGLPPYLGNVVHRIKTHSVSAFGQLLYKVTPEFEVGLGTRWTDETRHDHEFNLFPVSVESALLIPEINSKTLSPELSLTYTPTEDLTVFGSLKQAYKSGSFIASGSFSPTQDNTFHDERVRGGEIGTKGRLFDRSVRFSLAGYYYKYKGLQVASNELDASSNTIKLYTRNAAGSKAYGVDFDASYAPREVSGLTLNGAVNWNISKYTDFNAPCWGGQTYSQGCNVNPNATVNVVNHVPLGGYTAQNLANKTLIRAPKWSINLGADYEKPVTDGLTVAFGVSTLYTSSYYNNITLRDDMRQSGYFKTNANIALRSDKGWELAVIGNNIGNKIVSGNCINGSYTDGFSGLSPSLTGRGGGAYATGPSVSPAGSEELLCTADPGRSVMLRLTLKLQDFMRK